MKNSGSSATSWRRKRASSVGSLSHHRNAYERLLKQIDKFVDQYDEDEEELANQLQAMVDQAGDAYEEETIDEEETTSSSH